DVAMWMGRERQVLEGALAGIPFWPQTAPLLAELKKRGLPAIIISSGFRYLADKLARECGFAFKEIHANDFRWDPGGAMRGIRMGVSGVTEGKLSKGAILRDACYRLGIDPAETLAVGDSTSDLPMFEAAGTSILLNDKPVCAATATLPPGELLSIARYL
ncbi:MAG: HAD-IB family phosphatase, partial [Elusimicrobiota bacterium]